MSTLPRIRSIILCDDVRTEDNGKEILIGVYSGGINFNGPPPGRLLQLNFRIEIDVESAAGQIDFSFEFISPSNAKVFSVVGQVALPPSAKKGLIRFSQTGLVLYEPGTYKMRVGFQGKTRIADTVDITFLPLSGQAAESSPALTKPTTPSASA